MNYIREVAILLFLVFFTNFIPVKAIDFKLLKEYDEDYLKSDEYKLKIKKENKQISKKKKM